MDRLFEITGKDLESSYTENDLPLRIGGSRAHIPLRQLRQDVCLIGEIDGYLFLQPLSDQVDIFHNHEKITGSVWIKSGDETRIGKDIISYKITGDIVTVTIQKAEKDKIQSAPEKTPASKRKAPLPRVDSDTGPQKTTPLWVKFALPILFLLCLAAIFLLASETMEIAVSPAPDRLDVSGFPPPLRLGGCYLAIPGPYTLEAKKAGYRPLRAEIELNRMKKRFEFTLLPLPGLVDITTMPSGNATVKVDGSLLGITPLRDVEIEAGNHTAEITRQRYRKIQEKILVAGRGIHQQFTFKLEPAWGTVRLRSVPEGSDIFVDGRKMDAKTPSVLELTEGRRKILVKKAGYQPSVLEIDVKAGEEISPAPVVLAKAPGTLKIETHPEGALVAVDGLYKGKAPLQIEVSSQKTHKVSVSLEGHKPGLKRVTLGPGQMRTLKFRLEPLYCTVFISSPPGTGLFIDGKAQKKNSGRFQLAALPHTIEIRGPKGVRTTRKITPLPGSTLRLDMRLEAGRHQKRFRSRTSGQEFILMQPGKIFTMGSSRREAGRLSNEVRRKVLLERPFYISTMEVTNAQFGIFDPEHSSGSFKGFSLEGGRQPVVNITWAQAVRYLNWLSIKDGLRPFYREEDGRITVVHPLTNGYRLPTEAEWAWAARFAGRNRASKYPWQGTFPPDSAAGNFADESAREILPAVIRGYNDGFPVSSPVGSFRPNPGGLFDMGGNAAEWCHDFYSPVINGFRTEKDPLGPPNGTHHVVRGSSWQDSSVTELRLSYRGYSRKARLDIGFRIARYEQ